MKLPLALVRTEKLGVAAAHIDFATMMSKIVRKLSLQLRDLPSPQSFMQYVNTWYDPAV